MKLITDSEQFDEPEAGCLPHHCRDGKCRTMVQWTQDFTLPSTGERVLVAGAQIWHLEIEINNYCKVPQSSTVCTCLNALFLTILPEHLCLAGGSK